MSHSKISKSWPRCPELSLAESEMHISNVVSETENLITIK